MAWHRVSHGLICSSVMNFRESLCKSRILRTVSLAYPRIESVLIGEERDRSGGKCASFFQRSFENSRLLHALGRISAFCASLSMGTLAGIGALYGIFSTLIWFFTPQNEGALFALLLQLGITAVSVPFLGAGESLGYEVEHSRILGRFLFSYCGCARRSDCVERAPKRVWLSLILAFALAMLGIWIPIWQIAALVVLLLWIRLVFYVPEIGVLTLFFGFPFFNLLASPTLFLAAFSALLLIAWWQKQVTGKRPLRIGVCELFLLGFALCYLSVGVLFATGMASRLEASVRILFLLIWFPVRSLLENPKWRERAVRLLCVSSFLVAVWGISEYFFGQTTLQYADTARFFEIERRVTASYRNPNFLALYLTLCAPFSLGLALDERRTPRERLFFTLSFLTVGCCTVLTWTRGAWLGMGLSVLLFCLLRNHKSFLGVCLLPAFLGLAIPFVPSAVSTRFLSIGSLGESSIRYRLYTWTGVERMLAAYPHGIGVGEAAFSAIYPRFAISGTERVMHTHRLDLQLRSELGIIGFLVFCGLLLLLVLRYAFLLRAVCAQTRVYVLAPFCALLGALVMGAFDDIWYHMGNFWLFWVVAAMGMQLPDKEEANA